MMPYIADWEQGFYSEQIAKLLFKDKYDDLVENIKSTDYLKLKKDRVGRLNFMITKILLETEPSCYQDFNSLIGVLECVKLEFYRRMVAPYEIKKCQENGDVYCSFGGPNGVSKD